MALPPTEPHLPTSRPTKFVSEPLTPRFTLPASLFTLHASRFTLPKYAASGRTKLAYNTYPVPSPILVGFTKRTPIYRVPGGQGELLCRRSAYGGTKARFCSRVRLVHQAGQNKIRVNLRNLCPRYLWLKNPNLFTITISVTCEICGKKHLQNLPSPNYRGSSQNPRFEN